MMDWLRVCAAEGERPGAEAAAPGRGEADGGGGGGDGVAVPGAGEGRDVARAGVAQGVDGLLGVQAGPERVRAGAGAAAAGARRPGERQLLLPRVHADGHDPRLGEAHRGGGCRDRGAPRPAPARRAPHGHLLQVVHAAALLQALTAAAPREPRGIRVVRCGL
uniref:cDNA clone:001-104-E10, full insert sequence n=1 Tax=Oryza sativa subsp. japonica TaxID=39947 RepID=B7EXM4_ORYSJ|nr:unnamed protein product [Oryza sativa Japonica Group]